METQKAFKAASAKAVEDKELQLQLEDNIARYDAAVEQGKKQYANLPLARKRGGYIRHKAINGLEKYLIEFEANFEKNGGKVLWAQDAQAAVDFILEVLKRNSVPAVTKSGGPVTDEIDLDAQLLANEIRVTETNPGNYLLSLLDKKQRNYSSPTIHLSKKDFRQVLSDKFRIQGRFNTAEIVEFIRKSQRSELNVQASINVAEFLIADTGSVCISENAGDAAVNSVIPNIQIVIAGIDKMLPSLWNLDVLLPLYSTYKSGERLNAYNTIISGPRQDTEGDGPDELYVILLDNGRSNVLEHKEQRMALTCIECGACQNVCPVYRKIGGDAFGITYTGPIGSIITPWMRGSEEYGFLSYASTLSGKSTESCPVNIQLTDLLVTNRMEFVERKQPSISERLTMNGLHKVLRSRKLMDWGSSSFKNSLTRIVFGSKVGNDRSLPEFPQQNFKQLWESRREGKQ